jgi:hypothetical protein
VRHSTGGSSIKRGSGGSGHNTGGNRVDHRWVEHRRGRAPQGRAQEVGRFVRVNTVADDLIVCGFDGQTRSVGLLTQDAHDLGDYDCYQNSSKITEVTAL